MGRSAIFLDRDGVINENLPDHVCSWADFQFLPGVLDALRALAAHAPLFIVTNQGAIGRQLVSREGVEEIHRLMLSEIRAAGGEIAEILYCPHAPEARCQCRKPEPGMLLDAAGRFDLDLRRSVFIGDALTDILAGRRAGCRTILVHTGRGRDALHQLQTGATVRPTAIALDLASAIPTATNLLKRQPTARYHVPPISIAPAATEAPVALAASGDL